MIYSINWINETFITKEFRNIADKILLDFKKWNKNLKFSISYFIKEDYRTNRGRLLHVFITNNNKENTYKYRVFANYEFDLDETIWNIDNAIRKSIEDFIDKINNPTGNKS